MIRLIKESEGKRDIMELPASERVDMIIKIWRSPFIKCDNTLEYMQYFEQQGWNTSNYTMDEFNHDWDLACDEYEARYGADEEDVYDDDDDDYEQEVMTKEEAAKWLDSKLHEYGNTYFFPQEDRYKLDRLIDRFGSTYFWRR